MDTISFHVNGSPAPKGSMTRMPHGGMIPAGTAASRKRFADWRTDIRTRATEAMGERDPFPGAIRLMAEFQLSAPTNIPKYKIGWLPHTKRPDFDKLTRALCDAMTGIVWVDDSQVCYSMVNKVYAWNGKPGVEVIVDFLDAEMLDALGRNQMKVQNVIESL